LQTFFDQQVWTVDRLWHLPAICTVCSQVSDSLSAFQLFCSGSSNCRAAGRQANAKKGSKPRPCTSGKGGSSKAFTSPSAASGSSTPYQWCTSEPMVSSLCVAQKSISRKFKQHVSTVHKDGESVRCQMVRALSSCMHWSLLCVTSKHGVRQGSNSHFLKSQFGIMCNVSHLLGSKPQAVCLMQACCCR